MSEPITTTEQEWVASGKTEKHWTYNQILELFPDGDGGLVNPLVHQCQTLEAKIERLQVELDNMSDAQECAVVLADDFKAKIKWLERKNHHLQTDLAIFKKAFPCARVTPKGTSLILSEAAEAARNNGQ